MEMELNNLIDKIKKEGVEQADKEAAEITRDAHTQAADIIEKARLQSEEIIKQAKQEAKGFRISAERSMNQASRDVLIALRKNIQTALEGIVNLDISESLKPDILKDMILKAIEGYNKENTESLEILLNGNDRKSLEDGLFKALGKDLKDKITLKDSKNIERGFRIGESGKDSYIDFTQEAITGLFIRYLNPRLAGILNAQKGKKETDAK